jgi:hypothetical protein
MPTPHPQVVKQQEVFIDPTTGTFTISSTPGFPAGVVPWQISSVACDAGECFVRKDTTLVPPSTATTLRLRGATIQGLFMWHW